MLYEITGQENTTIKGYKVRKYFHKDIKVKFVKKGISDKKIPYKSKEESINHVEKLNSLMEKQLTDYTLVLSDEIDKKERKYLKKCKFYLQNIELFKSINELGEKCNIKMPNININDFDKYSIEELRDLKDFMEMNLEATKYLDDFVTNCKRK